jgi:hypothetical protein
MPYLRNAPLIGGFFGSADDDEDDLADMTPDQMRAEVLRLRQQVESQEAQMSDMRQEMAEANFRIQDLVRYYDNWREFRQAQAAFSQMLAHSDPNNFVQFFGYVDETLVPQLVDEARRLQEAEAETREMVRTLAGMEESAAGEVLERWMLIDLPLMVRVLREMGPSMRGAVLETLEATARANMLLFMSSPPPTFTPIVPNLRELPPLETVPIIPPVIEDEYYEEEDTTPYEEEAEEIVDEVEYEIEDEVEYDEVEEEDAETEADEEEVEDESDE